MPNEEKDEETPFSHFVQEKMNFLNKSAVETLSRRK